MVGKTISVDTLDCLRERRRHGESVKVMADELGMTWQKLDKALRNGMRGTQKHASLRLVREADVPDVLDSLPEPRKVPVEGSPSKESWVERYRPLDLDSLYGQPRVRNILRRFLQKRRSQSFLFHGDTGTGKTSAAMIVARILGCAVGFGEMGGISVVSSGEQTADNVRDLFHSFRYRPLTGSGWRVAIINEADRMSSQAEYVWLDRLESLPECIVVIFTTNLPEKLSDRFRDRCMQIEFESSERLIAVDLQNLLYSIWLNETGKELTHQEILSILRTVRAKGQLSFRRAIQVLEKIFLGGSDYVSD